MALGDTPAHVIRADERKTMSKTARPDKLGLAARRAALALSTGVREHGKTLGEQVSDPDGPLADLTPEDRARAQ